MNAERWSVALDWQLSLLNNVKAVRRNAAGLRQYARDVDLPDDYVRMIWGVRERVAGLGEPFYFSGEISRLMVSVAREMPPWTLTEESLPCPIGNFWFADPPQMSMSTREGGKESAALRGFGWIPCWWSDDDRGRRLHETEAEARAHSPRVGRMIVLFYHLSTPRMPQLVTPAGDMAWEMGATTERPWPYQTPANDPTEIRQVAPIFAACLAFIAQRIIVHGRQPADRASRRRAAESLPIEPFIRVVALRRSEPAAHETDDARDVEWSCRWLVSGHWRQQPYRSKGIVQPIYIAPYVKGPDDKPLKPPRGRIFAVVR